MKTLVFAFLFFALTVEWLFARFALPPQFRPDLFLYIVFICASTMKPFEHLLFSTTLGYLLDCFSGCLWGFHVATYVFAVSLIRLTSKRVEMRSYLYQFVILSLCAGLQGVFLLLYWCGAGGKGDFAFFANAILVRTAVVVVFGIPAVELGMRILARKGNFQ
ncbi:MAG TPA: rod shape-determining protein MreD [Candidatus Marinimicrobia bacterium]|nr:rod shape-determining protein MreD [Candidatus Neomarinimicrobiota bacterium]